MRKNIIYMCVHYPFVHSNPYSFQRFVTSSSTSGDMEMTSGQTLVCPSSFHFLVASMHILEP